MRRKRIILKRALIYSTKSSEVNIQYYLYISVGYGTATALLFKLYIIYCFFKVAMVEEHVYPFPTVDVPDHAHYIIGAVILAVGITGMLGNFLVIYAFSR